MPLEGMRAGLKRALPVALPLALGLLAFFLVVGPRALYPTNIAWLEQGDPSTHYLGWAFFRDSPWSFPIGRNPAYGIELASAIVYSDSVPLFAFAFKPFSPLLPEPFQYFGLWLLLCFVLQAWLAWKLVGLVSKSVGACFFGAGLFVLAPPMLWRLQGHFSLVGHFIVLAALYLALRQSQRRRSWLWGALLIVAALVHPYLLAMSGLLWLADLAEQVRGKRRSARAEAIEFLAITSLTVLVCWQAGYFTTAGGTTSADYGLYRLNVFSLIDPSAWSFVLKDLPEGPGDYEGFNYLGLGVLMLVLICLPQLPGRGRRALSPLGNRPFLLIALIVLALYALTHHIGIGRVTLELPLSRALERSANVFRSSGRMFWPVYYAILFGTIVLVVRHHGQRMAVLLLGLAVVVQALDTSAGWIPIRQQLMTKPRTGWRPSLENPFWTETAKRYDKLRILPPGTEALPAWQVLARYADTHGLATDAVNLARVDAARLAQLKSAAERMLGSGTFDRDTLYVLSDRAAVRAIDAVDTSVDLLARIDGFNVLAPGWKQCRTCSAAPEPLLLEDLIKPVALAERVPFNDSTRVAAYLIRGWSHVESWGVWSEGSQAEILLPVAGHARRLVIEAHPLVSDAYLRQRVTLDINGVAAWHGELTQRAPVRIEVAIDQRMRNAAERRGMLRLVFRLPDAVRPKDIGINADTRKLGLGLHALTVN